jgi:hypothetical protein
MSRPPLEACYEAMPHDALLQFLLPIAVFRYKYDVRSFRLLALSTSHEAVLPAVLLLVDKASDDLLPTTYY